MKTTKAEILALGATLFGPNGRVSIRSRSSESSRWVFKQGFNFHNYKSSRGNNRWYPIWDITVYAPTLDALAEKMKAEAQRRIELTKQVQEQQ